MEFDNINSRRDKLQDLKVNHLKLEVDDTYTKYAKLTTDFEPTDNSDNINKGCPDEKLLIINGHFSFLEKDYNEYITIQQATCRRKFDSESCENEDTNTLR